MLEKFQRSPWEQTGSRHKNSRKEIQIMKKKSLYIAGICAALSVGALGCASSAKAGDKENKPAVEDTKAAGRLLQRKPARVIRLSRKTPRLVRHPVQERRFHPNLFVFMVRFRRLPAIPSRLTISRESAVQARW